MSEKINGRMPEEIKKGLECCLVCRDYRDCLICPYGKPKKRGVLPCDCEVKQDILALIQHLERERDAAVADMTELMHLGKFCRHCKHLTEDGECTFDFAANKCAPWNCWQWRGVQEVE